MGPSQAPTPPPQIIQVPSPAADTATQAAADLAASKPLIQLGQAQFNQQLPFIQQNLQDAIANQYGSVENAAGAGTQEIGNTVGGLTQQLASLNSQSTQAGASGAVQALNNSIANAQAQAAVRPIVGLYSPTGQDQAIANAANALVQSYMPRKNKNQVDDSMAPDSVQPPPNFGPQNPNVGFGANGNPYASLFSVNIPTYYGNPSLGSF